MEKDLFEGAQKRMNEFVEQNFSGMEVEPLVVSGEIAEKICEVARKKGIDLIIMGTRLAKEQLIVQTLDNEQVDTIRRFNFLVDLHYKTKRRVSDYADMLFKSPKTLSNLFAIYNQKSPQQIILDRIALEAKRLINYTDKQNQEIAFELGFNDPAHFSRFFKKMTQMTPSEYRGNPVLGT